MSTCQFPPLLAQTVTRLPAMWETRVRSLGREDPPEKETATQPTPVSMPGKPHGPRSQVGYSPRGRQESARLSDVTSLRGVNTSSRACFLATVLTSVSAELEGDVYTCYNTDRTFPNLQCPKPNSSSLLRS